MFDKELTLKILGDVGPLRFNPYVIKVCQGCGISEKRRYKGFGKPSDPHYCTKCIANRPEKRKASSIGAKKGWQSNEYRTKIVEHSKSLWQDPQMVQKMTAHDRDPINKAKLIERNKNMNSNSKWIEAISNSMKKTWENIEYRRHMISELSRISRESWQKPEFRKGMKDLLKRRWKDPIFRDKMTNVLLQSRINMPHISSLQTTLYSILDDLGIKYYREYPDKPADKECIIGPYSFDCVIPRDNKPTILVECQGEYWHKGDKPTDRAKASYINQNFINQYEIKYIWEHEFSCKDRIISLLKYWLGVEQPNTVDFDFESIKIKDCPASDYRLLLSKYHYLANAGRGGIAFGAYLNDVLIAVCVFSPLIRQNLPYDSTCTRELSRLCIHPSYQKKNFGSWFITRCIKQLDNKFKTIISYCDTTFNHDGAMYKACNFILDGEVEPDYWYIRDDGWVMHKKTLYNHAIRNGFTESSYADTWGYKKVFGLKKLRFIFNRD